MKLRYLIVCSAALAVAAGSACQKKQNSGKRDSGQSRLMDQSFAGQNACNPENHDRPFIIEWDATDMSSFESLAANDIVFVKYEGCNLKVLDECKNDSIRGEQGAYKPPEWTSGSLEVLDIHNEAELTAKLPLAQATLGGRVSGGESFHMEYFVAGTRMASRDAVYASDLEGRYGCDTATHFVYGYNLGAFALASASDLEIEAGGSAFGFGATGKTSKGKSAEKKGGDLGACAEDSATEVAQCKAPIRLSLRKIRPGDNPEKAAMAAPDDPESMSAAAVINTKIEMSEEAQAHYTAAVEKFNAGDGKGCLKELDLHDQLDPKNKSEDPKSHLAMQRSLCVMKAGKCKAGKVQLRKHMETQKAWSDQGPERMDMLVEHFAAQHCEGKLSNRDALLKALKVLNDGAYIKKIPAKDCLNAYKTATKLLKKVKARDEDDSQIFNAPKTMYNLAPTCLAKAGDCANAWKVFNEAYPADSLAKVEDPEVKKKIIRSNFESLIRKCKDKVPG
jgi:hypothetical protein